MEEINIKELLYYFLKRIPIIIIITIAFLIIGTVYTYFGKTKYYSSDVTIVLVSGSNEEESTGSGDTVTQTSISINEKLVATYREIVTSRKVLNQVISDLDFDYTLEELQKMISVSGVDETEIIKIIVKSESSSEAKEIANKTAEAFEKNVQEIYDLKNVAILDEAIENEEPYNDNKLKDILIFFIIGFVISCALLFVMYYFDDSVQTAEGVEKRLGIPVIGQLPLNVESSSKTKKKKRRRWLR